jgi:hypothetical protein
MTSFSRISHHDPSEARNSPSSNISEVSSSAYPRTQEPSTGTAVITDDLDDHMKEYVWFEFFIGQLLQGKRSPRSIGTNAKMWKFAKDCGLDRQCLYKACGILAVRAVDVSSPPYGILCDDAELFEDMKADFKR